MPDLIRHSVFSIQFWTPVFTGVTICVLEKGGVATSGVVHGEEGPSQRGFTMKMDIEKVAKLARLELSKQESETLGNQLEQILSYMEQLNHLDTKGIEPTSHAIPVENAFREDETRPSCSREEVLGISPDQEEGHFRVLRIIE